MWVSSGLMLCVLAFSTSAEPLHLPLFSRNPFSGDLAKRGDDFAAAAQRRAEHIRQRYGYPPSEASLRKRVETPGVEIYNEGPDVEYFFPTTFGTPPQPLNLTIDTNGADVVIVSSACTTCTVVETFDSSRSSTFKQTTAPLNGATTVTIPYTVGNVEGIVVQDVMSMGEFSFNQTAVLVQSGPPVIWSYNTSGTLGLGFPPNSKTGATTAWQSLVNTNQMATSQFSLYLTRFINDSATAATSQAGGVLTLGGTNDTFYTGDIEYMDVVPINVDGTDQIISWALNLSQIVVNSENIALEASLRTAIIEVASGFIAGPSNDVAAIFSLIPGSGPIASLPGHYVYPCSSNFSISLAFGGKSWPVNSADLSLGIFNNTHCYSVILDLEAYLNTTDIAANPWLIGAPLLKNVYSVFSSNPNSIGFAQLSTEALNSNPAAPSHSTVSAGPTQTAASSASSALSLFSSLAVGTWATCGATMLSMVLLFSG